MKSRVMAPITGRVFYGWIALAGAMLTAFTAGGVFLYSFGVFLPVMCAEFEWSRGVASVGLSLGLLTFGLPSPLYGLLIARFGPRINMVWGNILGVLGLAGMYLVQEVWHVYLLYSLTGLGIGLGGYIACTTIANNWFVRKRPLAMGIFASAAALGGFVFPPLTTVLISSFEWRVSWLVLAGIVFVVAVLISGIILVRDRPEDMGLAPDGVSVERLGEAGLLDPFSGTGQEPTGWQTKQAMRVPTTWIIAAFASANYFALGTMVAHQVAHVQDLGFSPVAAAMTMSLVSGMGIVGRLGCGVLALRFNIRYLAVVGFVIQLMALGILILTRDLTIIYIYAVLFGISNGSIITTMPTIIGEYYGRAHYAQILGVIFAISIAVESAAPAIAGAIYDATDIYTMAFIIVAAFSLAGLICVLMARRPMLPQGDDL
jgi:MFS family permease